MIMDHGFKFAWNMIARTCGTMKKITCMCVVVTGWYCNKPFVDKKTVRTGHIRSTMLKNVLEVFIHATQDRCLQITNYPTPF